MTLLVVSCFGGIVPHDVDRQIAQTVDDMQSSSSNHTGCLRQELMKRIVTINQVSRTSPD